MTPSIEARSEAIEARVAPTVAALFGRLSRWRGARVFHPHGLTVRGELHVEPSGLDADLFRTRRRADALVRLSRGVGLPEPWPDVLGVAVRVLDAYGPDRHQDLLLVTAVATAGARFVLVPARHFDGHAYSSLLPYRVGGVRHLFGATVAPTPTPIRVVEELTAPQLEAFCLTLRAARPLQAWTAVATFTATDVLSDAEGEALRFDPWNCGGGIEPEGFLQRLRAGAYPASQRGRPDTTGAPDRGGTASRAVGAG